MANRSIFDQEQMVTGLSVASSYKLIIFPQTRDPYLKSAKWLRTHWWTIMYFLVVIGLVVPSVTTPKWSVPSKVFKHCQCKYQKNDGSRWWDLWGCVRAVDFFLLGLFGHYSWQIEVFEPLTFDILEALEPHILGELF